VHAELRESLEGLQDLPATVEQLFCFGDQGLIMLREKCKELELAQLQGVHVANQQEARIEDLEAVIAHFKNQLQERQEEVEEQRQALEQDLAQMQEYRDTISKLRKQVRAEQKKGGLMRDATTQVVDRRVEVHVRNFSQFQERPRDEMPSPKRSKRGSAEHHASESVDNAICAIPPPDLGLTLQNLEQITGHVSAPEDRMLVACV
jgi:chromosome segregation ATPase